MQTNSSIRHRVLKASLLAVVTLGLCTVGAAAEDPVTVETIKNNLANSLGFLAQILQYVSIIVGVGFIFGSFHKFHQNKVSPQQHPISNGIVMLLIGCALIVFPHLLQTGTSILLGKNSRAAQIGGSEINDVIGKGPGGQ